MITGDNALTACHVAKELKFTKKNTTLLFKNTGSEKWLWESIDQTVQIPFEIDNWGVITGKYDLCLTGEVKFFYLINKVTFY